MASAGQSQVVVVGSSFAGLTAALKLRKRLGRDHHVVVLDRRDHFTFIPSLIWLPFGLRDPEEVTFPLADAYARKGIEFRNEAAARFDLERRVVETEGGAAIPYDRLIVATGPRYAFDRVPGLGPEGGHTASVCNLDHAIAARADWDRLIAEPGPVVVGTAQGGSCFGASYEFAFNARHQLDKAGLADRAPVTFITSEPFVGHFGLGGVGDSERRVERRFAELGIEGIPSSAIRAVRPGEIELESGRRLPFAFAMVVPPFTGVDAVRDTSGLGNAMGFVPVEEEFRHPDHPEVFAAGVDIAIAPPGVTPVPAGVPKTGQMTEVMAGVAAQNVAADLTGGPRRRLALGDLAAFCILDAGDGGIVFKADHVLGDPEHPRVMAGPQAHWAKLAFERYFISTRRRGSLTV